MPLLSPVQTLKKIILTERNYTYLFNQCVSGSVLKIEDTS